MYHRIHLLNFSLVTVVCKMSLYMNWIGLSDKIFPLAHDWSLLDSRHMNAKNKRLETVDIWPSSLAAAPRNDSCAPHSSTIRKHYNPRSNENVCFQFSISYIFGNLFCIQKLVTGFVHSLYKVIYVANIHETKFLYVCRNKVLE